MRQFKIKTIHVNAALFLDTGEDDRTPFDTNIPELLLSEQDAGYWSVFNGLTGEPVSVPFHYLPEKSAQLLFDSCLWNGYPVYSL